MPKSVDQAERRVAIAEASWRLVLREGVGGVSVRAVAAEAGLATASLRQTFPTQDALLSFCFELVLDRAQARIASSAPRADLRERAEQLLQQALPLDTERRAEMQIWLALTAASLTQPRLAPIYARGHDALRGLCRSALRPLVTAVELEPEAARVHALLDGLAMHVIARPGDEVVETARLILARHLVSLTTSTQPLDL